MSDMKLDKVWRVRPVDGWGGASMSDSEHGGYVPYTTYCHNVAKLQKRVRKLEQTIIGLVREAVSDDVA